MAATSFDDPLAEAYRSSLRDWLEVNVPGVKGDRSVGVYGADDQVELGRRWDVRLWEGGYSGQSLPTEFYGKGLGLVEDVILYEELGRSGAPEGFALSNVHMLAPLLIEFGTERQRSRYLRPLLNGTDMWCQGSSEPEAGSDLASLKTVALREGDDYRIDGRKTWTSNAHHADRIWMLAKTLLELPRHHNLSLFLVDLDQPAITIEPIRQISGPSGFSEVTFDGAFVAVEDRVGPENEGWQVMRWMLDRERGILQAMRRYHEITGYVKQARTCLAHLGRTDCRELDDLSAQLELVRWHVVRCVEDTMQQREERPSELILKLYWSELWQRIAQFGMDLNCALHREVWRSIYIYARSTTIWAGTSQIQRNIIAERALGMPPRMTAMTIVATDEAHQAAQVVGKILQRSRVGQVPGDSFFNDDHESTWNNLVKGEWHLLGAAGDASFALKDLVVVIESMGMALAPVSLSATLIVNRHAESTGMHPGPGEQVSICVPDASDPARVLVPFPALRTFVGGGDLISPVTVDIDTFAPSLPIGFALGVDYPPAPPVLYLEYCVLLAAEAVGAARRCLQLAVEYSGQRVAFGRPIAKFQALRHLLADAYTGVEMARTAACAAANDPDFAPHGVALSLRHSRGVVEQAIQTYGGLGFTWEAGLHFYLRHVLAIEMLARSLIDER